MIGVKIESGMIELVAIELVVIETREVAIGLLLTRTGPARANVAEIVVNVEGAVAMVF